jgi:hypothetical protein
MGPAGPTPPSSDKSGSRLELDEADGRIILYGATSQAHIQRHAIPVETESPAANFNQVEMDSEPLRVSLLTNFWKMQPRSQIVVDEELFLEGRAAGRRSEYFSSFLESAILSVATRLSTSLEVRSLGARYADRAKTEIAGELENPTTATLQSFLLLSDFEATRGRHRLGYLYAGIGCRLVWDLGLPENCDAMVAQQRLTQKEAHFRHLLLLCAFVYDKTWSLYLGRPGQLPISTIEDAHAHALSSGWTGPTTIVPWVGLCTDISEVTDILNSGAELSSADKEKLLTLDYRLKERLDTLPLSIRLHNNQVSALPAEAYSVHIQFHGLRIILHRLLYQSSSRPPNEGQAQTVHPGERSAEDRSRLIMYENAIDIAQLVSLYHQIFGIEQVVTIMLDNSFVSAAVLISHVLGQKQAHSNPAVEREMYYLRALADMLSKAQRHYPVTLRMRYTLSTYVENTQLAGMFGNTTTVQPHPNHPNSASRPQMQSDMSPNYSMPDMTLRNDLAIFQDWSDDVANRMFQEMDMPNMMSWALSPSALRPDLMYPT